MYIHIGEDLNIRVSDIIAILDKESVIQTPLAQDFLSHHEDKLLNLSKNSFKSVIITENKVYLSPIASGTLKKRSSLNIKQEI